MTVTLTLTDLSPSQLADIAVALGGPVAPPVTGTGSGGTNNIPPPPTDTNTYPFKQPTDFVAGGTWEAGTGPDTVMLALSSNPANPGDNTVSISINGVGVAYPVDVKSHVGETIAGCDNLIFHGPWGANPIVTIAGMPPGGNDALWIMSVMANGTPLVANGVYNSRGGAVVNATEVFVTNNAPVVYGQPVEVAATSPAPVLADPVLPAMTADLIGTGQTIDATGHCLVYDKAILVPTVSGLTVKDVILTGARLSAALGGNGAGVRNADVGIDFTLDTVEIHDCDNGVLTFPCALTMNNVKAHDNGSAVEVSGLTHNVYHGGGSLIVNNYTGYGATQAHDIKTRAETVNINGMVSTAGGYGRCLDVPNGGTVNVTDATWTIPATAADRTFFGYGTEGGSNTGRVVTLTRVHFNTLTDQPGQLVSMLADSVLNLVECTCSGVAPNIVGWGTVNGTISAAT